MSPTEGCYFITKSYVAPRAAATVETVLSDSMQITEPGYMDAKFGWQNREGSSGRVWSQFDGKAGRELAITLTLQLPTPEPDEYLIQQFISAARAAENNL